MHHAYLLIGDGDSALEMIDEADRVPGPDVIHYSFERFTITDARQLGSEASLMPVERKQRVFILSVSSMTLEAQNALLKLFEDPVQTVKFYVIAKTGEMFLPTLRSRFVELKTKAGNVDLSTAESFIALSYKDRLDQIATKMKDKDIQWSETLLDALEVWVEKEQSKELMSDLVFVRSYEKTQSASRKMLLEHLALTLPVKQ